MASKRRSDKTESPRPTEPVREVAVAAAAPGRFDRLLARLKTLKGAVVAIAGVGAVLGGLAGYWNAYQAARSSTESSKLLALVGKGDAGPLSIVVLPFANLTGDPQQAYLADGLSAAITSDLSRIRDAFIVGTATAFAYKDKPLTVQQIGKELGVRFALQGGVQRSGDRIRINAQLADTTTNAQLWSESFDGSQGDLFALQEMVTARIGNSIGREMVILTARESERRKSDPNVVDLLLRGRAAAFKPLTAQSAAESVALYRQVLLLAPTHVEGMAQLAASLAVEALQFIAAPATREKQLVEARDLALHAQSIDPKIPVLYVALALHSEYHGDVAGMRHAMEVALDLEPKSLRAYRNLGGTYISAGEPRKGIELVERGIRLDPRHVDGFTLGLMGFANFMVDEDGLAIQWLLKTLDANPADTWSQCLLAMAYARKGDLVRSREAAAAAARDPNNSMAIAREMMGIERRAVAFREWWEEKLLPAWRLAGLPE